MIEFDLSSLLSNGIGFMMKPDPGTAYTKEMADSMVGTFTNADLSGFGIAEPTRMEIVEATYDETDGMISLTMRKPVDE